MEQESYITEEERIKCRKVVDAYSDLYEKTDILVLEAGQYGFVKLQYFDWQNGFEDVVSFFDSRTMFEDLWGEWYAFYLFNFTKGTPMAELSYKEMYKYLPQDKQKELMEKKAYFVKKAGMDKERSIEKVSSTL